MLFRSIVVGVSSGVRVGSVTEGWSYDGGSVSAVVPGNGASRGSVSVSVFGGGLGSRRCAVLFLLLDIICVSLYQGGVAEFVMCIEMCF